jgi:hypothetical protein
VVFYIAAMWIAGVMQGLMWRATNDDGTLTYTFVESLKATYPYYLARFGGGVLVPVRHGADAPQRGEDVPDVEGQHRRRRRRPGARVRRRVMSHEKVETNVSLMGILVAIVVAVGGLVQIVPLMYQAQVVEAAAGGRALSAAGTGGRDIYVREGCYNCHSQMVRTLRSRPHATDTIPWPANRYTTVHSSGEASVPGPIWPASAAAIRTTGIACT